MKDELIRKNDVEELIRNSDVLKHLSWDDINKLTNEIKGLPSMNEDNKDNNDN